MSLSFQCLAENIALDKRDRENDCQKHESDYYDSWHVSHELGDRRPTTRSSTVPLHSSCEEKHRGSIR